MKITDGLSDKAISASGKPSSLSVVLLPALPASCSFLAQPEVAAMRLTTAVTFTGVQAPRGCLPHRRNVRGADKDYHNLCSTSDSSSRWCHRGRGSGQPHLPPVLPLALDRAWELPALAKLGGGFPGWFWDAANIPALGNAIPKWPCCRQW